MPAGPKKISRSVQVGVLKQGEFFGEVEVFNETPRASAVLTTQDSILLALSKTWLEAVPPTFLDAIYRYSVSLCRQPFWTLLISTRLVCAYKTFLDIIYRYLVSLCRQNISGCY